MNTVPRIVRAGSIELFLEIEFVCGLNFAKVYSIDLFIFRDREFTALNLHKCVLQFNHGSPQLGSTIF